MSSFKSSRIDLGLNNTSAEIGLCGSKGIISYKGTDFRGLIVDSIDLESQAVILNSKYASALHCVQSGTSIAGNWIAKSYVAAEESGIYLQYQFCNNYDYTNNVGVWETSSIAIEEGGVFRVNAYRLAEIYASGNIEFCSYGGDIRFNPAIGDYYIPYYKAGDSVNAHITTGGYVTNSGTDIWFTVPLAKPIIGSPSVSAESLSDGGIILLQNTKFTHGSASSTYAKPSSYTATIRGDGNFVQIKAVMSTTTNVVNNAPIGILWRGKIKFS
jgi:hypothetical protein